MKDTNPGDVVILTCAAVSPHLLDKDGPRFKCSKRQGHGGDHGTPIEWPADPQLFGEYPWHES